MLKYLAAAALLGTASAPSLAQWNDDPPSVRVIYADLDLTRAEGQAILDKRLVRATRKVCSPPGLIRLTSYRCIKESLVRARGSVQIAVARAVARKGGEKLAAR